MRYRRRDLRDKVDIIFHKIGIKYENCLALYIKTLSLRKNTQPQPPPQNKTKQKRIQTKK